MKFDITRVSVQAKTRALGPRWTIELWQGTAHLGGLVFRTESTGEAMTWLRESGYEYQINSDVEHLGAYNVEFIKEADAAHFKLTWC